MPATLTCYKCGHELTRPDITPLESPFPDLLKLGSNAVLPSLQANIIASSISSALHDVSQLDQDILRLENTIVELCRKRDERQAFAMAHKAIISPIRQVPPEIITETFLYSAEGNLESPIFLASICSRWRTIALSSPQLWASFRMSVNPGNLESQIALATMWLSRAGRHPLSIDLGAPRGKPYPDAALARTQSLVDLFIARCEQWQTIELSLPPAIIECFLGAKDRLHRLEKLTFGSYIDWDNSCQDISAVFSTAPKLRSLSFDYLFGTHPRLPWRQLHELSMNGLLSAQSCLDILKTTSSLHKCEFWIQFAETEDTHAPSSITLPVLRHMSIHSNSNLQDLPYFFSALHLPMIQELIIVQDIGHHSWEIHTPLQFPSAVANAIAAMISHGSLLKLDMNLHPATQITPAGAVSILRAAPKLMELSLVASAVSILSSREFVDQFNASNACLVPNLQKLELDCCRGLDMPIALDMVEGRCLANYGNALTQLLLRWRLKTPLDDALKSRLLRMTQSGLDIQLYLNDDTMATPINLSVA